MTTLEETPYTSFKDKIKTDGIRLKVGPFNVSVESKISSVARHMHELYAFHTELEREEFIDFQLKIDPPKNLRRWIKPQITFSFDGFQPFTPLPLNQACAQLEWGLNWCIAGHSHQFLVIHSAVVEKNGIGLIIPGIPGSGKSTLCAGLNLNGWRLLSDEMALISLDDLRLHPVPRPISLKNISIDIIREHQSTAKMGAIVKNTTKGDIVHIQPDKASVERQLETVSDYKLIFPKYIADSDLEYKSIKPAEACMELIKNSFNFNILGTEGFHTITKVIDKSRSYSLQYGSLQQAFQGIEKIVQ